MQLIYFVTDLSTSKTQQTFWHQYISTIKELTMQLSKLTFSDWGVIKHGVPQASILGPLLFLLYMNDSSKTIIGKSKPILFADSASIMFSNSNLEGFKMTQKFNLNP